MKVKCQNKQATSASPFGNYCAIMLSDALIKSGVSTIGAKVKKCWGHPGMKHMLLAEEMAAWLKKSNFGWLGDLEKISSNSFQDDLNGKTGIVFYKNLGSKLPSFKGQRLNRFAIKPLKERNIT